MSPATSPSQPSQPRRHRDVVCAYCERTRSVNRDGRVRRHKSITGFGNCHGSHTYSDGHQLAPVRSGGRRKPALLVHKENMKRTLYRRCECCETAHDTKYQLAAQYGGMPGTGRFVWACRNCGTLAIDRRGAVKLGKSYVRDGRNIGSGGIGGDDPQTDKGG